MTVLPLHMGPLHGFEAVLFYLLAFGPFLALAGTVVVVRRRDAQHQDETERP
jgi:hypothetical protein